jgi:hypothetical protein
VPWRAQVPGAHAEAVQRLRQAECYAKPVPTVFDVRAILRTRSPGADPPLRELARACHDLGLILADRLPSIPPGASRGTRQD